MNPSTSTDQSLNQPPPEPHPEQADAPNANTTGSDGDTATKLPSRPVADTDATLSPSASKRPRTEENIKVMPLQYETCNAKDLGMLISNMLMELIRLNDQIPLNGRLTRFHSRAPPGISCHDYLQRLIQHATLSPPILLSMVYYIDRLCALYPAFNVSSLTVHRFLIVAATVASKGLSDSFWTNPTYARIGGITTGELATLEMEFLQKVEWRIVPKPEVLVDYYISLVQRSAGYGLEQDPHGATPSDLDHTAMDMDPP
ncbi:cyclin-domain-containing protein [Delphinella strobiligena]|nr:cyclin-domain-containing protein [Delphinella strobiligena]